MIQRPVEVTTEHHAIVEAGGWLRRIRRLARGDVHDTRYARQLTNVVESTRFDPLADVDIRRGFRVVVPASGGLDSSTCLVMAVRAGLPVVPVYIDSGVDYCAQEINHASQVCAALGLDLRVEVIRDVPYGDIGYIQPARNLLFLVHLAEWVRESGWWGEVWFGDESGEGERDIVGGDKSHRYYSLTQHLLSVQGYDLRIVNPLVGMTKVDEVWFLDQWSQVLPLVRSCHRPGPGHCGECWACLRLYVALKASGMEGEVESRWPNGHRLRPYAREWERRRLASDGVMPWNEARLTETRPHVLAILRGSDE